MKLTLCYSPMACSLIPLITLNEAGATFDIRAVNMAKGEHNKPDYLELNPKHKVPVLIIDGEPLTENVAIQIWIARNFPQAKLLPAEPMKEIRAISAMAWLSSNIHPLITPQIFPQRYCDLPGSEASVRKMTGQMLAENYGIADQMLKGREYFFDHFTAVDAYFFWCFRGAERMKFDVSAWPNATAHLQRMLQRPSVQKALAFEKDTQEAFARAA